MDKLQWFKFSPVDWVMGKIQKCPPETRDKFMSLCCLYWNKETVLTPEEAIIEVDQDHFDILLAKKVIKVKDDLIRIHFLDDQYAEILETSDKRRGAALKKWELERERRIAEGLQIDASALQVDEQALQNDADKSRTEQNRTDKNILCISGIEMTRDEAFELFWDLYKKPVGKKGAMKAFSKIKKDDIDNLFVAVPRYVSSTPDKQFRKHPTAWLNGRHWEDEVYVKGEQIPTQETTVSGHKVLRVTEDGITVLNVM